MGVTLSRSKWFLGALVFAVCFDAASSLDAESTIPDPAPANPDSTETSRLSQIPPKHLPVATTMTVRRMPGTRLMISLTSLATNWTGVDGRTVTFAGVHPFSTNGMSVAANRTWIFYANNSISGNDEISYLITDGHGDTNVGLVDIVVPAGNIGTKSITLIGANSPTVVTANGVPGFRYTLQRSSDLSSWVSVDTNTAAAGNGLISLTDDFGDLGGAKPPSAFYRLFWHP
jgi:Cadherin-like domain